jgi:polyhydroxyalkanoate synthesis regulator phasin
MAEAPDWSDWRQILETGKEFTAMTRAEAQQRAQELVREGQLAQERMQMFVDDLVRTSRKRADELVEVVRKEIQRQLEALGIAPRGGRANGRGKKKAKKKTAKKQATDKKATKKKSKAKSPAKKKTAKAGTKKAATKKKAGARKPSGTR